MGFFGVSLTEPFELSAIFFESPAKTFLGLLLVPIFNETFSGGGVGTPVGGEMDSFCSVSSPSSFSSLTTAGGGGSSLSFSLAPKLSLIVPPSSRLSSLASSSSSCLAVISALSIWSLISFCSRSSSPLSCRSFFLMASCRRKASGELSIQAMKRPSPSFSSTRQMTCRPRCLANSVREGHFVEFCTQKR